MDGVRFVKTGVIQHDHLTGRQFRAETGIAPPFDERGVAVPLIPNPIRMPLK
jgi:hypothetical protein